MFPTKKLKSINNDLLPTDIGPKHVPIHSGGRLQVGYCYRDMVEFSKGPHLERRSHNSSVEKKIGNIVHCSKFTIATYRGWGRAERISF